MRQIHHVGVTHVERYVLDPQNGPVKRREEVLSPSSTVRINWKNDDYDIGDDLTFLVPDECAEHFLRQPGWHEGLSPFAPEPEAEPKAKAKPKAKAEEPEEDEEPKADEPEAEPEAEEVKDEEPQFGGTSRRPARRSAARR